MELTDYITDGRLAFAKYGRGGIIIKLESDNPSLLDKAAKDHARGDVVGFLYPVFSMDIKNGIYTVTFIDEGIKITREMPASQVSIETYSHVEPTAN